MRRGPWPAQQRSFSLPEFDSRSTRWGLAALVVALAVALFVGQASVREGEAWVAVVLLTAARIVGAQTFGSNVLFSLDGAFVGVNITAACSAALLISPFFLLAAGLLLSRRTSVGGGLRTLGLVATWLFVMNQVRIVLVVLSMRLWGFERGYELTHIALGSVLSTFAVFGGVALFVRAVSRSRVPAQLGV